MGASATPLVRLISPFGVRVEVSVRSGPTPPLVRRSPPAWPSLDDDTLCWPSRSEDVPVFVLSKDVGELVVKEEREDLEVSRALLCCLPLALMAVPYSCTTITAEEKGRNAART